MFKWSCNNNGVDDDMKYRCRLKKTRCRGLTASGNRCSRNSLRPYGICWQHIRKLEQLNTSKNSNILDSSGRSIGRGLFAYASDRRDRQPRVLHGRRRKGARVFKPGDVISKYFGEELTAEQLNRRYGIRNTAPYTLQKSNNLFIDSACIRNAAAFANGSNRLSDSNAKFCQARSTVRIGNRNHRTMNLKATKSIYHDDEIIAYYGRGYELTEAGCRHQTK